MTMEQECICQILEDAVYDNPLRFIDPDGRLEDWYEDDKTGDIAWHDGSATRVGQTNITKKRCTNSCN